MHRLTGAKLTKLIDVLLWNGYAGKPKLPFPLIETTAHTSELCQICQAGKFEISEAKLK
jgi:hypothetical protein